MQCGNCSNLQKILIHFTVIGVIALFHNTDLFCNCSNECTSVEFSHKVMLFTFVLVIDFTIILVITITFVVIIIVSSLLSL